MEHVHYLSYITYGIFYSLNLHEWFILSPREIKCKFAYLYSEKNRDWRLTLSDQEL